MLFFGAFINLGSDTPAAPGTTVFGAGYYRRRRRFMAYILE